MPTPDIDFEKRISRLPEHLADLPPESASPIEHYRRSANDAWNLLVYFKRNVGAANTYKRAYDQHTSRLRSMVLLALVESFERFLKELAALCIDQVAPLVLDDRLSQFSTRPRDIAAHFEEQSLGRALAESDTWLDSDKINRRFRQLLAKPSEKGSGFWLFPREKRIQNTGGARRWTSSGSFVIPLLTTWASSRAPMLRSCGS